jgi:hypothetical protein
MTIVAAVQASELAEFAPLARRALTLDPASLIRIRAQPDSASALVQLPFGVLAGRRIAGTFPAASDTTFAIAELLGWLDADADAGTATKRPAPRDSEWRVAVPPSGSWRRVETVPDGIARDLVRIGALTLKQAAEREGVPNAQPRADVADALLDSIVLTAEAGTDQVPVSLRLLSALVRMGFLARDSHLAIDLSGRWLRLAASYGSVYAERPGQGLRLTGLTALTAQPHGGVRR